MIVYRLKCTRTRQAVVNEDYEPGSGGYDFYLRDEDGKIIQEEAPNPLEDDFFRKDNTPPGVITVYDNLQSAQKARDNKNSGYLDGYRYRWYDIVAYEMNEVPM